MDEAAYRQFIELEHSHFWFVGRRRIFFRLLERELGHSAYELPVGRGSVDLITMFDTLEHVMGAERHLLVRLSLPFGHSIIAIARG